MGTISRFEPPLEFEPPSDPVAPPEQAVHPLGSFSIKTRYLFQSEPPPFGGGSDCIWDSDPRALGKPPGEACNPRRPAPQRRSNPALPATSKQHHEVIGRRRRRQIDRWCCFFQLRLYISRHQCHNRIRFFTYPGKCKVLVNPFLCFWWSCTIIVPQNWRGVSGFAIFLKVRCDL